MTEIPFGLGAILFVGGYLVLLLVLGYLAKRQRVSDSLGEFYLAGRNLGGFVLFLTLYATQYSGNSLLGYPGEAYRLGFAWLMSVGFMMAIVVVYLIFAPRLYQISRRYRYVTPGDYIKHRFGSPSLTLLANLFFVAVLVNYLLAQLMAMGHIVSGLSGALIPCSGRVVGEPDALLDGCSHLDFGDHHLRNAGRNAGSGLDRLYSGSDVAGGTCRIAGGSRARFPAT